MSAVVELVKDVVGGIVEAVGDVVETVVDVVKDVGRAIDDYIIQPILDDPLSAIATVAGAYFLGPAAASMFGTSATVGAGIAAGAANTAAGLVQGEEFGEAIKGGLMAGATTWAGGELFGGQGAEAAEASNASTDVLGDFLAQNNNFADVSLDAPIVTPDASGVQVNPIDMSTPPPPTITTPTADAGPLTSPEVAATAPAGPSPLENLSAPDASAAVNTASPLQSLNTTIPQVEMPSFTADYGLSSGMKPDFGLQVPKFNVGDSLNIYGEIDYGLVPPGTSGGPGLQLPSAPNLTRMGGGQGITADVYGLPQYMENGIPTTFEGANGQLYGNATPDVTISQNAITPTPQAITYDATTNVGTPSLFDQVTSGDLTGAAKTLGNKAVDWYKTASPWEIGTAGLGAATLLNSAGGPPNQAPPPRGSTQDKNFTKSLDLYNYMRDKTNYQGDLTKYGQTGEQTPGEHQYFQNTRFVPIPIPAKMGGLIQMKHFARGGMAQGMQGRPQMPQGGGRPMMPQGGMAQGMQGRPPMMQGRPMSPQNAQGMPPQGAPQGMPQGRPQMPQRPRDPKMAYYQYGNPPVQAKAMGGLSQVHSMKIGGGADGRSDDVNAVLSDGEYVMDAETVAMLGNGSSKAGAAKLDQMRSNLRQHKGRALAGGKISPDARSPLAYLKGA